MKTRKIGFFFLGLVLLLACNAASQSAENANRDKISQQIQKRRQLFADRNPFPQPHISPILRITNRDLVGKVENLYFEALDYQYLSLKCLKHAQVFLDNGEVSKTNEYIQKSDRYYKVAISLRRDSQSVLDGTYAVGETAAEGVKDACETAVKIGLKVANPAAGKAVDYIYIGVDYVVESATIGADEARKNAAKRVAVQILFDQVKFKSLGNRTVADYMKYEGGKSLSGLLDRLVESQEWKTALSKIIQESGVTLSEDAVTNTLTKERQTSKNQKDQVQRFSIQQYLARLRGDEKKENTVPQPMPAPPGREIPERVTSIQDFLQKKIAYKEKATTEGPVTVPPSAPKLISPGSESKPGEEIITKIPTFTWEEVSNADSYALYIREDFFVSRLVFVQKEITGTSFSLPADKKLQDDKQYYWTVRARNKMGWSTDSQKLYFKVAKSSSPLTQKPEIRKPVGKPAIQKRKSQVPPEIEKPVPPTPKVVEKPKEVVKPQKAARPINIQKSAQTQKPKEVKQSKVVQNLNPDLSDVNKEIESLSLRYQIPPIIIKAICYHETREHGGWIHYDPDTGEVIVGKDRSGSFGYGIMQYTPRDPIITPETMKKNPASYYLSWKSNLEEGVKVLSDKWKQNGEPDVNKPYLEYWYYPIAWYNGSGVDAYNYVTSIYDYMNNPNLMSPQVAKFCRAVNISSPRSIPGWKVKTIESEKGKVTEYSLNEIVSAGGQVHRWNVKTGELLEYEDVTNQYRSTAVTEPTRPVAPQQPAVPTSTPQQPAVVITQKPSPPTTASPGSGSEPGPVIDTLTPTLRWAGVPDSDCYAIAISQHPYGSGNVVYNPQQVSGTSHTVHAGKLQAGKKYRWNMQAHNSAGWSDVSGTLYFQTAAPKPAPTPEVTLTLYVHDGSVNGPIIAGAKVTVRDAKGKSFIKTTNSGGYVRITGAAGSWRFGVSKTGYSGVSWSQDITSTARRDAYLKKVVEKPKSSAPFKIGDTVRAVSNLNVRTGPGTDYSEIKDSDYRGYAPSGTKGKIVDGPKKADGYSWWKVDFGPGKYSGWSVQGGIRK